MQSEDNQRLSRRELLRAAVLAIASTVLLRQGRSQQKVQKPLLTISAMHERVPGPEKIAERKAMFGEMKRDLDAYLRGRFRVRTECGRLKLSTAEKKAFNAGLDRALSEKLPVTVRQAQDKRAGFSIKTIVKPTGVVFDVATIGGPQG